MTAPTFLGLTPTPMGLLAAFSDGRGGVRIATVLVDAAKTPDGGTVGPRLVPFLAADYADIWPEPANCGWLLSRANGSTYPCNMVCAPGSSLCPTHSPTRAD